MQTEQQKHPARCATAADILGGPLKRNRINPQWKHHYNRLIELQDSLQDHCVELVKDAQEETPTYSLHMADAATDTFDRDFALSMVSSDQNALYEIREAINRILTNTYGLCELTGEPIAAERLEAVPWTRFSVKAKQDLENRGSNDRARFADRGNMHELIPAELEEDEEAA